MYSQTYRVISLPVGMHCHGYVHDGIQKYWGGGGRRGLGPPEKVFKVVFFFTEGVQFLLKGVGVGISL